MVDLWYDAFGDPINRRLYPDTPGARAWLEDYHRASLQSPDQHYLKIVTDTAPTSPLVAFVKWDFNTTTPGHHFPPRHVDFDQDFCDTFFGGLDQARRTIMGARPHYCMFLYLNFFILYILPTIAVAMVPLMVARYRSGRLDHPPGLSPAGSGINAHSVGM
jgi:hypothetical protein